MPLVHPDAYEPIDAVMADAARGGSAIVNLLLLGYAFVTQLFPAMVMSLHPRNPVTTWGAGSGMVVGVAVVAVLTLDGLTVGDVLPFLPAALHHLNVGVIALAANVVVCAVVSAVTRARPGAPSTDARPTPDRVTSAPRSAA